MKVADLHLHTRYSDGAWTPAELVHAAHAAGLAAIAITDHDTLDGVPETLAVGKAVGVEIIPGVEITCRVETQEIHLLGYFFGDGWQSPALVAVLDHAKQIRKQRIHQMVARLNDAGMPVTVDDVLAGSDCGTLGRPHVARALVRKKIVGSVEEAFDRFLKRGKPGYVERYRMTAAEAIGHVRRAGGVAVLAHPGLNHVDARLRDMKDQGLGGIEVWHTRHSPAQSAHYLKLTEDLALLPTGGSDCHGPTRGGPLVGSVTVPYDRVEALRQRALLIPR